MSSSTTSTTTAAVSAETVLSSTDQLKTYLGGGSSAAARANASFAPSAQALLFYIAEGMGTIAMAELLIERGAEINAVNGFGEPLIAVAAFHGNADLVDLLIKRNAKTDTQFMPRNQKLYAPYINMRINALIKAAEGGRAQVVKILLKKGLKDEKGMGLIAALRSGSDDTAAQLVRPELKNLSIDWENDKIAASLCTPLHIAAYLEMHTTLQNAVVCGFPINAVNKATRKTTAAPDAGTGESATAGAAANTAAAAAASAAAAGSSKPQDISATALHIAIAMRDRAAVKILTASQSLQVNTVAGGRSALMLLEEDGALIEEDDVGVKCLSVLLNLKNIDLDIHSAPEGRTALGFAVSRGYWRIANRLLRAGALKNGAEKEPLTGQTILHLAAGSSSFNTDVFASILLKAPLNEKDNNGYTAAMTALFANNMDAYEYLIEKPALDINITDREGNNLVMLDLLFRTDSQNISVFLARSPDLKHKNNQGQTALHVALSCAKYFAAQQILEAKLPLDLENAIDALCSPNLRMRTHYIADIASSESSEARLKCLEMLFKAAAKFAPKSLITALRNGLQDVFYLIYNGRKNNLDINTREPATGDTILMAALASPLSAEDKLKVVSMIMDVKRPAPPDLSLVATNGFTVLHHAIAGKSSPAIISLLMQNPAVDPAALGGDPVRTSALHILLTESECQDSLTVLSTLLQHKNVLTMLQIKDSAGLTPAMVCAASHNPKSLLAILNVPGFQFAKDGEALAVLRAVCAEGTVLSNPSVLPTEPILAALPKDLSVDESEVADLLATTQSRPALALYFVNLARANKYEVNPYTLWKKALSALPTSTVDLSGYFLALEPLTSGPSLCENIATIMLVGKEPYAQVAAQLAEIAIQKKYKLEGVPSACVQTGNFELLNRLLEIPGLAWNHPDQDEYKNFLIHVVLLEDEAQAAAILNRLFELVPYVNINRIDCNWASAFAYAIINGRKTLQRILYKKNPILYHSWSNPPENAFLHACRFPEKVDPEVLDWMINKLSSGKLRSSKARNDHFMRKKSGSSELRISYDTEELSNNILFTLSARVLVKIQARVRAFLSRRFAAKLALSYQKPNKAWVKWLEYRQNPNPSEMALLIQRAWKSHLGNKLIKNYLNLDYSIDSVDSAGYSGAHIALMGGHEEFVNRLLRASAISPNIMHPKDGSVLHLAAKEGYISVVQTYLNEFFENNRMAFDVNMLTPDGRSALQIAYTHKQTAIVELLIRHAAIPVPEFGTVATPVYKGVDLDIGGPLTMLQRTVAALDYETSRLLWAHGANINARGSGLLNLEKKKKSSAAEPTGVATPLKKKVQLTPSSPSGSQTQLPIPDSVAVGKIPVDLVHEIKDSKLKLKFKSLLKRDPNVSHLSESLRESLPNWKRKLLESIEEDKRKKRIEKAKQQQQQDAPSTPKVRPAFEESDDAGDNEDEVYGDAEFEDIVDDDGADDEPHEIEAKLAGGKKGESDPKRPASAKGSGRGEKGKENAKPEGSSSAGNAAKPAPPSAASGADSKKTTTRPSSAGGTSMSKPAAPPSSVGPGAMKRPASASAARPGSGTAPGTASTVKFQPKPPSGTAGSSGAKKRPMSATAHGAGAAGRPLAAAITLQRPKSASTIRIPPPVLIDKGVGTEDEAETHSPRKGGVSEDEDITFVKQLKKSASNGNIPGGPGAASGANIYGVTIDASIDDDTDDDPKVRKKKTPNGTAASGLVPKPPTEGKKKTGKGGRKISKKKKKSSKQSGKSGALAPALMVPHPPPSFSSSFHMHVQSSPQHVHGQASLSVPNAASYGIVAPSAYPPSLSPEAHHYVNPASPYASLSGRQFYYGAGKTSGRPMSASVAVRPTSAVASRLQVAIRDNDIDFVEATIERAIASGDVETLEQSVQILEQMLLIQQHQQQQQMQMQQQMQQMQQMQEYPAMPPAMQPTQAYEHRYQQQEEQEQRDKQDTQHQSEQDRRMMEMMMNGMQPGYELELSEAESGPESPRRPPRGYGLAGGDPSQQQQPQRMQYQQPAVSEAMRYYGTRPMSAGAIPQQQQQHLHHHHHHHSGPFVSPSLALSPSIDNGRGYDSATPVKGQHSNAPENDLDDQEAEFQYLEQEEIRIQGPVVAGANDDAPDRWAKRGSQRRKQSKIKQLKSISLYHSLKAEREKSSGKPVRATMDPAAIAEMLQHPRSPREALKLREQLQMELEKQIVLLRWDQGKRIQEQKRNDILNRRMQQEAREQREYDERFRNKSYLLKRELGWTS